LSNQNAPHTDQGLLLDVSLGFDLEGRKIMGPVTLHPTRCLRQLIDNQPVFRATPVLAATANPEAYGLTRKEADRLLADRGALAWRLAHFDPAG
ncbi:MAG: hypothetical protein LBS31_09855, partial [Candidatus Adiutrix sp.]|nr:hypothetical protein [Candidatus Adiutrix sp.]